MKPIIFLDFDGVMNTPLTWGKRRDDAVDADKVQRLSQLVEQFNAEIVISSTWRRIYSLAEIRNFLERKGLDPRRVIDTTTYGPESRSRGLDIALWLSEHGKKRPYIILDDMSEHAFVGHDTHFIRIEPHDGFTDENLERARNELQRQIDA